jgi:hypothetical protein
MNIPYQYSVERRFEWSPAPPVSLPLLTFPCGGVSNGFSHSRSSGLSHAWDVSRYLAVPSAGLAWSDRIATAGVRRLPPFTRIATCCLPQAAFTSIVKQRLRLCLLRNIHRSYVDVKDEVSIMCLDVYFVFDCGEIDTSLMYPILVVFLFEHLLHVRISVIVLGELLHTRVIWSINNNDVFNRHSPRD